MKKAEYVCIGWIWYLQVEFWAYAIFPLNALLYNVNKIFGIVFTLILIMGTVVQNFLASFLHDPPLPPAVSKQNNRTFQVIKNILGPSEGCRLDELRYSRW